ncbi:MAG: DUF5057 domain-containing protein [Bacillota bacterium]
MKKVLSWVMIFMMVIAAVPHVGFAGNGNNSNNAPPEEIQELHNIKYTIKDSNGNNINGVTAKFYIYKETGNVDIEFVLENTTSSDISDWVLQCTLPGLYRNGDGNIPIIYNGHTGNTPGKNVVGEYLGSFQSTFEPKRNKNATLYAKNTFTFIGQYNGEMNQTIQLDDVITNAVRSANAQYNLGDFGTIEYRVSGNAVNLPSEIIGQTPKEIVLVIDTSGSMDWDINGNETSNNNNKRITYMKTAAKNFVDRFENQANVKIGIVSYDYEATLESELKSTTSYSNSLKSTIDSLSANGGTNTGDGLRMAYWLLKNSPNLDAQKYIVSLTDGDPTFRTIVDKNNILNDYYSWFRYYSNYDDYWPYTSENFKSHTSNSSSNIFIAGTSNPIDRLKVFTKNNRENVFQKGHNQWNEENERCLQYAEEIGEMIKDEGNFSSYVIGFSNGVSSDNLQRMGLASGADEIAPGRNYAYANTGNDLGAIYAAFADEIINQVPLENAQFSELLPEGIDVDTANIPQGFSAVKENGRWHVIGTWDDLVLTRQDNGTYQIEESVKSLPVIFNRTGAFNFSNQSASLAYNVDGSNDTKTVLFSELNINVVLTGSYNILEITDSGESDIAPFISQGSNIELTTLSMKKFVALREALDGKYDVIYMGSGEYDPTSVMEFDRSTKEKRAAAHATKGIMNDITNLKADEIIHDFINKGQPVILHNDIFNHNDSNLYARFNPFRSSGRNNVRIVTSAQEAFPAITSLASTLNRPEISLTNSPISYVENSSHVYHAGDTLQYQFTIDNQEVLSEDLTANLYIDRNFNKNFESDELVAANNASNGSVSYTLPGGYSTIHYWMLEVVGNNSGLKDYKTGVYRFRDIKTVVKVLQVRNSGTSLNNTNQFNQNYLHTDDYDIQIDVVNMNEFNKVNSEYGYSVLNGKYDMVIFGFQDSYGDGGISNQAVAEVERFIQTGQSTMLTHDTLINTNSSPKFINYLMDEAGQLNELHNLGFSAPQVTTETAKVNEGILTQYPFILDDNIRINQTHDQYYTLNLEDEDVIVWYNLRGGNRDIEDSWYHYYTYSKGNVTYSGTGHTNTNFPDEEQKLFVNTMYRAFLSSNHNPEINVISPNAATDKVVVSNKTIRVEYTVEDYDPLDSEIDTEVWIEDQKVYEQTVANGTTINRSFNDYNIEGNTVDIRIIAVDTRDARAVEEISLPIHGDISLNAESKLVKRGDTVQLTASITPEFATHQDINWTSTNNDIVSISGTGSVVNLHATNVGIVDITAATADDEADCNVIVGDVTIPDTTIEYGSTTDILASIDLPNGISYDSIQWSSDNTSVVSVTGNGESASLQGISIGKANVTITVTIDGETIRDQALITVADRIGPSITIDTPIMGDNIIDSSEKSNVTISGTTDEGATVTVEIRDENGNSVTSAQVTADDSGDYVVTGIDIRTLEDSLLTIIATATDDAGNQSSLEKVANIISSIKIVRTNGGSSVSVAPFANGKYGVMNQDEVIQIVDTAGSNTQKLYNGKVLVKIEIGLEHEVEKLTVNLTDTSTDIAPQFTYNFVELKKKGTAEDTYDNSFNSDNTKSVAIENGKDIVLSSTASRYQPGIYYVILSVNVNNIKEADISNATYDLEIEDVIAEISSSEVYHHPQTNNAIQIQIVQLPNIL